MNDDRLIKTVMKTTCHRERPAKRWFDDIVEGCDCSLPEAVRLTSDRQRWREHTGLNDSCGP